MKVWVRVAIWASLSRVVVYLLGLFFGLLVADYDTSSSIELGNEIRPEESTVESKYFDSVVESLIRPFGNWDSLYFLTIAERGYEYEKLHAFFPGLPFFIWLTHSILLFPLSQCISIRSSLLLSGFIVTNLSFVLAAVVFFHLSRFVSRDETFAFRSAILFSFTPAGVFMSAVYTESVYSLWSFVGFYFLEVAVERNQRNNEGMFFGAAVAFAVATFVRSNGMVYAIFLLVYGLKLTPFPRGSMLTFTYLFKLLVYWGRVVLCMIIVVLPMLFFQYYTFVRYCKSETIPPRPWCELVIPDFYSFVQAKYWGVGFLNYYQLKQIPNFLLASPMIILSSIGIGSYVKQVIWKNLIIKSRWTQFSNIFFAQQDVARKENYYNAKILVYIFHWAFLLFVAVFIMNVQVITRFLSSCPALYWYASTLFDKNNSFWKQQVILIYFTVYTLLGCALFCNFYPWT